MLTFILGGARSGKSRLAHRLAAVANRVCYVATAVAGDDPEMIQRIARHRADRPQSWQTVEAPLALAEGVERSAAASDTIVVDCLTIWLSNLFWEYRQNPACIEEIVRSHLQRIVAIGSSCRIILVSNEVGCGTVPAAAVARAFRDTHGLLNQWVAEAADEVILAVAGLPQYLKSVAARGTAS